MGDFLLYFIGGTLVTLAGVPLWISIPVTVFLLVTN